MRYQVILTKRAEKNLKKVDSRYKGRILTALVKLRSEPYLGKTLRGDLKGKFSLRIWPYRIIYEVFKGRLIVYVISIEHRQGIYRRKRS